MIPYSYNMVDMGGIDLAEANGTVVSGVYEKIVEAINLCGDLILYNWKFAGIDIAPSAYTVFQQAHSILINGLIQVTESDQVTVIGLPPPIVPVSPLEVIENGLYEAQAPASGFNPVRVQVPPPIISSVTFTENGVYPISEGIDGYGPITVDVPERIPVVEELIATSNGIYTPSAGVDGFTPVTVNVPTESPPFYFAFQQGGVSGVTNNRYDMMFTSLTNRIRLIYPIPLGGASSHSIVCNSGYNFALYTFNSNGLSYDISGVTGTWLSSIIVPSGVYYLVIMIRKEDNSNISPSEAQNAGITIT